MMIRKLRLSSLIIFLLALTSCKTAYFTHVDEVVPPKKPIPAHILSIHVIDRSIEKSGYSTKSDLLTETDKTRNSYINSILYGLPVSTKKSLPPRHDGVVDGIAPMIHSIEVPKIAAGADALLSLDQFELTETRTYKDIKKNQLDPSGNKYTIEAVSGKRLISLRTNWRLYDVKTNQMIMNFPQYTENSYETEGLTRQSVNLQMDTTQVVTASTLAKKLSAALIKDINPMELTSQWQYYTKGNDIIKKSAKMIKLSDFRNAAEYLSVQVKNIGEPKYLARAYYNLVVAYYFNNQRDKALQMAAYQYNQTNRFEFKELYDKIYAR